MITALLLCGILGPFGAHRYYAGKIITGTLQLLTLLSAIGWVLVDFPYHDGNLDLPLLLGQLIALFLVNLWPSVDFYRLISGRFTDRDGNKISE